jgi:hypothetical protein
MSAMDRIYGELLLKLNELETFVNARHDNETDLITRHLVIAYRVNGTTRYLELDRSDVMRYMEQQATSIRSELAHAGKCDPVSE